MKVLLATIFAMMIGVSFVGSTFAQETEPPKSTGHKDKSVREVPPKSTGHKDKTVEEVPPKSTGHKSEKKQKQEEIK